MIAPLHTRISLERRLGGSDVTEVWSARLEGLGRCALKRPVARWSAHRGAARLIEREYAFLERAAQPGVVRAIGLLETDTGPGLLTAYLGGGDLVPLAGSHPKHWAEPVRDVVQALAGLHARGIVHRDVKPRNVLLDGAGRGHLIDFGSARESGRPAGSGGGTPAYLRADRGGARAAEPADDVHALAVMTYELLCERLPFGIEPDARALETPPVPPLMMCPAYADEPALVELAAVVEALLAGADAEGAPSLGELDARLGAIIAAPV